MMLRKSCERILITLCHKQKSNFTIICIKYFSLLALPYKIEYWTLPNMEVMKAGESSYFWTLDGVAGWIVSANASLIHIMLVQPQHFGFYYCTITKDGATKVIKKALNYNGPYWGDLWEEYESNFIIAFSASGGFLVILLGVMLIWHFRYIPLDERKKKWYGDTMFTFQNGGYIEDTAGKDEKRVFHTDIAVPGTGFVPVAYSDVSRTEEVTFNQSKPSTSL